MLTIATCAMLAGMAGIAGLGFYSAFGFIDPPQVSIGRAAVSERAEGDSARNAFTSALVKRVRLSARDDRAVEDEVDTVEAAPSEPKASKKQVRRAATHPDARGKHSHSRHGPEHRRPKSSKSKPAEVFATMCVRLCDGAYFPVSHAATAVQLGDDAERCASSCASPARLYYSKSGDMEKAGAQADAESATSAMRDASGNRYGELPTAFSFRTGHVKSPSCTCHAQPWQAAAVERHENFALERAAKRGDAPSARLLALRRAVHDLRRAGPVEDRVALGQADWQMPPPRADRIVFGPQVVAPLDDKEVRAIPPPKYLGELKPLAVILDATGHTAMRKPPRAPQSVALLSVVREAETGLTTGSIASSATDRSASPHAATVTEAEPERISPRPKANSVANAAASPAPAKKKTAAAAKSGTAHSKSSGASKAATVAMREERAYPRRVAHAEPDWRELIFRPY